MPNFTELVKIISKILALVFALGAIFFETRKKDSSNLNNWGRFLVVATIIAFGVDALVEYNEKLEKIKTARAQIDSISNHTKILLDNTSKKIKIQFDALETLNNNVKEHIDTNQQQIKNQFTYAHQVQGDIKNLVNHTLSSTQKVSSIFLKWQFADVPDSIIARQKNDLNWAKDKVTTQEINYYKSASFLPQSFSRTYDDEIQNDRNYFYSFLCKLIQTLPGGAKFPEIPKEVFGLISLGDDYTTVIPFGNVDKPSSYGLSEEQCLAMDKNPGRGSIYEPNLPVLAHQSGKNYSVDWYIRPILYTDIVMYANDKQALTYLLPNTIRILLLFNVEVFPFDGKLTDTPTGDSFPPDWFDLKQNNKAIKPKKCFDQSSFFISPDGDPKNTVKYNLINLVKDHYSVNPDPLVDYCDYVVFTFKKDGK